MAKFSKGITKFLKNVGADPNLDIIIVPKSDSAGYPGDILFFRYTLGIGKGSRDMRLFMLVEPIAKDARTGNLLLTGIKVPQDREYLPDDLDNLYKTKGLPASGYRTYIMSRIHGPLRRIVKNK